MHPGMGSGRGPCSGGWMCMGGAGCSDAAGRRKLCLSAGSVRRKSVGTAFVVSIHLANPFSSAAQYFVGRAGFRGLLEISHGQDSRRYVMAERECRSGRRGAGKLQSSSGALADCCCRGVALPAYHDDWKDFHGALGDRTRDNFVADLRRSDTFQCEQGVYVPRRCVELLLDFLRRAGSRFRANRVQLFGLLQRLQSGRRNEGPRAEYSAGDFLFDFRNRDSLFSDANEYFERYSVARSAELSFRGEPVRGANVWNALGDLRDRSDSGTGVRLDLFSHAGIFARAVCSGAGRKLLFDFCAPASHEAFSVRIIAGAGRDVDRHLHVF